MEKNKLIALFIILLFICANEVFCSNCLSFDEIKTKCNFQGVANKQINTLQITNYKTLECGSIWYRDLVHINNGFNVFFKFTVYNPTIGNGGKDDGGYPGADGFAFVMQTQSNTALGEIACDIGYAGIRNAFVIEFDQYHNTNEKGNNYLDNDANHIAIQYAKNSIVSAEHFPQYNLMKKRSNIKSDSTIYYCKVVYDKDNMNFELYVDTAKKFETPFISINNFNMQDYFDTTGGVYFGFSGGTGLHTQVQEILDWEICEYNEDSIVCDTSYFEYKDFENISGLKLLRNAQPSEGKILLCQSDFYKNGIMWRDRPLPVNGEWETEWSFSLNNPTQAKNPDNSFPGADGYSLIIQNTENGLNAIGENGLGLSYENLQNAIAIELDLFKNNKYQLEDRNDPSGNHIALILPSKNGKLSADHIYTDANHITSDIPEIKSNNTIYYAKVNYNATKKKLRIWLSDSPKYVDEVLEINDFDLSKYISLQNSQNAYIGIGASTGDGCQNHYIHSWKFCSNNQQSNPIINTSVENDEFGNNFYDLSLVNNSLYIKRKNIYNYDDNNYNLIIYDNQGKESLRNDIKFTSGNTQIDINSLPLGIYFVRLVSNGEVNDIGKFIKK